MHLVSQNVWPDARAPWHLLLRLPPANLSLVPPSLAFRSPPQEWGQMPSEPDQREWLCTIPGRLQWPGALPNHLYYLSDVHSIIVGGVWPPRLVASLLFNRSLGRLKLCFKHGTLFSWETSCESTVPAGPPHPVNFVRGNHQCLSELLWITSRREDGKQMGGWSKRRWEGSVCVFI